MLKEILVVLKNGDTLISYSLEAVAFFIGIHKDFTSTIWINKNGFVVVKDKEETISFVKSFIK